LSSRPAVSVRTRQQHSLPTRRSSDLAEPVGPQMVGGQMLDVVGRITLGPFRGAFGQPFQLVEPQQIGVSSKSRLRHLTSPLLRKDRKSTRLTSSHVSLSYAVFCLKQT